MTPGQANSHPHISTLAGEFVRYQTTQPDYYFGVGAVQTRGDGELTGYGWVSEQPSFEAGYGSHRPSQVYQLYRFIKNPNPVVSRTMLHPEMCTSVGLTVTRCTPAQLNHLEDRVSRKQILLEFHTGAEAVRKLSRAARAQLDRATSAMEQRTHEEKIRWFQENGRRLQEQDQKEHLLAMQEIFRSLTAQRFARGEFRTPYSDAFDWSQAHEKALQQRYR